MNALYVHIPFCNHICSYCDFSKVFYKEDWVNQYLEALSFEIQDKKINKQYDSIYIGGGTPSSLSLFQLEKLLKMLQPYAHHVIEYSIEVNPESMNDQKLYLFKKYHINRLSIGVQTFHDHLLSKIQRYHTSKSAIQLIQEAQKIGFEDINIDLIYGLPNQTLQDVDEDIQIVKELDISHISIYSLILEDATFLKKQNYQPLSDEEDALWYDHINDSLSKIGFKHYEVSNYYKKKPSLHNLVYWHYEDYDGIGLSSHSLNQHHRFENTRSLTKYLNFQYLDKDMKLSNDDEIFEKIMMGLRLTEGIYIKEIENLYHIDFMEKYKDIICKYAKLDMLEVDKGFLKTTELGMKYLNTILIDFLE